jgi:hypothetical protein
VPKARFSFRAGDVFHVALVWDREGIDGTTDTMRAYINGTLYGSKVETWDPDQRVSNVMLGHADYPQWAAIDNLVVWNYAKTDFSYRFEEDPLPHTIASVHLYQPEVSGCIKMQGTVRLAEPAPAGGLTVALHSDNEHAVVPASVVVKEGALMKRFQILTSPVAVRETATITASVPGQEVTAILGVKPMVLKDLVLSPNPVVGGNPVVGTMTLQCPAAPGDIEVTLASKNPSIANPTVSHITIPFGTQVMTFDLTTTPVTRVYTPAISATANGVKRSRALTVSPAP